MKRFLVIFTLYVAILAPTAVARESGHPGHDMGNRTKFESLIHTSQVDLAPDLAPGSSAPHSAPAKSFDSLSLDCNARHCPACFADSSTHEMCPTCFMEGRAPSLATIPPINRHKLVLVDVSSPESTIPINTSSDSDGRLDRSPQIHPRLIQVLRL